MSVNKSAKCFFADKYQDWYVNEVLKQLNGDREPHDVKVDVRLPKTFTLQSLIAGGSNKEGGIGNPAKILKLAGLIII